MNVEGATDDETNPLLNIEQAKATEGGNQNQEGYETEYYDSSDNRSIVSSDAEDVTVGKRKSKFPQYNLNVEVPEFCIGMVFKEGKQFKKVVRKYSRCVRKELKFVKNELRRIRVKCVTSGKCPWRIFVSYSKQAKGYTSE